MLPSMLYSSLETSSFLPLGFDGPSCLTGTIFAPVVNIARLEFLGVLRVVCSYLFHLPVEAGKPKHKGQEVGERSVGVSRHL